MNTINAHIEQAKLYALSQPKKAYENAKKALEYATVKNSKYSQGQAYFYMAFACRVMSDYVHGLSNALKGLSIFEELGDNLGIMKARNITGIIYFYYGDYASALENFMIALSLSEQVNDLNMYSSVVNNIGEVYREAKDYEKALSCYLDALEITESQIKDPQLELNAASIYLNIGEIYYIQKEFSNSLEYMQKALELAIKHNNIILIGEAETKLGRAMIELHDYQKASMHYQRAREHYDTIHNKFYKIELLIYQAKLSDLLGNDSLGYLEEALTDAALLGLDSKVSQLYNILSNYYEQQENYQEALNYYKYYSMKEKEIEASNLSQKLEILSIELEHNKSKKDRRHIREITRKLRNDINHTTKELEDIKQKNMRLIQESMMDELTQTYNRRGIQHQYNKLMASHEGQRDNIAVYMIDIDFFKAYNDSLGHIQGDICLGKVAAILKSIPTKDYFVGRFGGEEFVVIAKVKTVDEAKDLAEHMRQQIEKMQLMYYVDEKAVNLTISIGAKYVESTTHEMLQVIDFADKALYKAKQSGRNCVCFY